MSLVIVHILFHVSKNRVIVLSVVLQGLSKAETARKYGVSWRWVHELVTRYEHEGMKGLEPRSRKLIPKYSTGWTLIPGCCLTPNAERGSLQIDTTKNYWRNQLKPEGRWPKI